MADYRAGEIDHLEMRVGETRTLDSLRQAVVPPYVMVVPFVELPPAIELVSQQNPGEEGVHGAVFTLRARNAYEGALKVGFRDLRDDRIVIEKDIRLSIR